MRTSITAFALVLALIAPAISAAPPATKPSPTGRLHLTFTERNPVNTTDEFSRRSGVEPQSFKHGLNYELADESFELYVPRACRPNNPHGLFIWISPGDADLPADWPPLMDKFKLIWISPNNAGNGRDAITRIALALDAAHNMPTLYSVNPARIYIAGFSGGGGAASVAAIAFPDHLNGGFFMMGSSFYRRVPIGDHKFIPPSGFRPPDDLLDLAKQHPFVLMTGEADMNRVQTKAIFAGFKEDGFTRATYIELAAVGHNIPPARSIERGLLALNRPPATTQSTTMPQPGPRISP